MNNLLCIRKNVLKKLISVHLRGHSWKSGLPLDMRRLWGKVSEGLCDIGRCLCAWLIFVRTVLVVVTSVKRTSLRSIASKIIDDHRYSNILDCQM